jgi:hypothetical protein
MIECTVMGNWFQAARAAADRGIPFAFRREWFPFTTTGKTYTTGRVGDQWHDAIVAWAAENPQDGMAFPIGSLVHYNEVQA